VAERSEKSALHCSNTSVSPDEGYFTELNKRNNKERSHQSTRLCSKMRIIRGHQSVSVMLPLIFTPYFEIFTLYLISFSYLITD